MDSVPFIHYWFGADKFKTDERLITLINVLVLEDIFMKMPNHVTTVKNVNKYSAIYVFANLGLFLMH